MIVFTFNVYTISSPHWVNKQDKELKKNHRGRHCGTELKPHFGMMTFIIGVPGPVTHPCFGSCFMLMYL